MIENDTCDKDIYIDSIEHEYLVFLFFLKIGHTLKQIWIQIVFLKLLIIHFHIFKSL